MNTQQKTRNKHILFDIYLLPNASSHPTTSSESIMYDKTLGNKYISNKICLLRVLLHGHFFILMLRTSLIRNLQEIIFVTAIYVILIYWHLQAL